MINFQSLNPRQLLKQANPSLLELIDLNKHSRNSLKKHNITLYLIAITSLSKIRRSRMNDINHTIHMKFRSTIPTIILNNNLINILNKPISLIVNRFWTPINPTLSLNNPDKNVILLYRPYFERSFNVASLSASQLSSELKQKSLLLIFDF